MLPWAGPSRPGPQCRLSSAEKPEGRKRKASEKVSKAPKKQKWIVTEHKSVKLLTVDPFFGAAS